MEPGGLYDADLAAIHAAGFSSTYADGFHWLVTQIEGPLFDLGCGDGTWLRFAAGHGVAGSINTRRAAALGIDPWQQIVELTCHNRNPGLPLREPIFI